MGCVYVSLDAAHCSNPYIKTISVFSNNAILKVNDPFVLHKE